MTKYKVLLYGSSQQYYGIKECSEFNQYLEIGWRIESVTGAGMGAAAAQINFQAGMMGNGYNDFQCAWLVVLSKVE